MPTDVANFSFAKELDASPTACSCISTRRERQERDCEPAGVGYVHRSGRKQTPGPAMVGVIDQPRFIYTVYLCAPGESEQTLHVCRGSYQQRTLFRESNKSARAVSADCLLGSSACVLYPYREQLECTTDGTRNKPNSREFDQ